MSTPTSAPSEGAANHLDTGPLTWVMGEIREALGRSKTALMQALSQDADDRSTSLRHAKSYLHQAHGALQIVDIDGVAIITETIEDLLERMESGQIELTPENADRVHGAYQALIEYLEELLSDASNQPVRLFPYYRALLEVRGAERIHPADLFFPNLAIRPQFTIPADALPALNYNALRLRYEKALLPFLRKNDPVLEAASATEMMHIIADVERAQIAQQSRAFWWVMHGFAEGVSLNQIVNELYVKQLFARINLQLRRLSEGSTSITERLLRDALFFVARIEQPSLLAQQIRKAYQVEGLVPVDYGTRRYGQIDMAALLVAKEKLNHAKNMWNRIAGGDANPAQSFETEMKALTDAGSKLNSPALSKLLRELNGIARHAAYAQPGDRLGLEMATSLLFVENALNHITRLPDNFTEHAEALTARLLSAVAGEAPVESAQWLDDMSREAQQKQTMTVLSDEMLSSLRQVEKMLDEYFGDASKEESLKQIDSVLHQLEGALAVLDQDEALEAVRHTRNLVEQFAGRDASSPDSQDMFGQVAQNIGALSFFIETLQRDAVQARDNFSFEREKGIFRAHLLEKKVSPLAGAEALLSPVIETGNTGSGHRAPEEPPTVEQELAQRAQDTTELARSLSAAPDDAALQEQLKESLEQMRTDAALIDDAQTTEMARAAIDLLDRSDTDAGKAVADILASTVPSPVNSPASSDAIAISSDEEIDAELLEIFLSEAVEVLAAIDDALPRARSAPDNQDHLTTLRRSFHTLKGSGRMVGLQVFGEAAWSIEQVLNVRLAGEPLDAVALFGLLQYAHDHLQAWVDEIQATGRSNRTPDALAAAAERVKNGGAFTIEELPVAESAIASAPVEHLSDVTQADPHDQVIAYESAMPVSDPVSEEIEAPVIEAIGEAPPQPGHAVDEADATPGVGVPQDAPVLPVELMPFDLDFSFPSSSGETLEAVSDADEIEAVTAVDEATGEVIDFPSLSLPELQTVSADETTTSSEEMLERIEPADDAAPLQVEEITLSDADFAQFMPATEAEKSDVTDAEITDQNDTHAQQQCDDLSGATVSTTVESEALVKPAGDVINFPMVQAPKVDDNIKQIGSLEISVPLHGIYLAETDELVRILSRDIAEWRHEPERPVATVAVHAAHSLAGSSATVGFQAAQEVAHGVEIVLQQLSRQPVMLTGDEYDLLEESVTLLHAMLQQFAVGEMADRAPLQVVRLDRLAKALIQRVEQNLQAAHDAAQAQADAAGLEMLRLAHREDEETTAAVEQSIPHVQDGREKFDSADVSGAAAAESLSENSPAASAADGVDPVDEATLPGSSAFANVEETAPLFNNDAASSLPAAVAQPELLSLPSVADVALPHAATQASETAILAKDELDADLLPVFVEEGQDLFPQIGEALRRWRENPADLTPSQSLLRIMHTVKGSARMAGAMVLGQHMHDMETRIEQMTRIGQPSATMVEELLGRYDLGLQMFEQLNRADTPVYAPIQATPVVESLFAAAAPALSLPEAANVPQPASTPVTTDVVVPPVAGAVATPSATPLVRVRADLLDRMVNQAGEVSISRARLETEVDSLQQSLSELTENVHRLRSQLREIEIQAETQMASQMSQTGHREFDPLEFDRFTRLQELTRMMAESVNDVASVQQNIARNVDGANAGLVNQARLTRELQQDLMRVRMVQFASISERLYRVTRQTAKELDKRVNLDIRGGAVEIDRSVLERMTGPFEHLLRNAIVHGIESREARRGTGKEEIGELLIEIRQEGNEVVLQFSDDGQGLNLNRIRDKAKSIGLIGNDQDCSDVETRDLIFHPGFSTAAEVTELAGRGVGMDVVRSEVTALGGRIAIRSEPGQGAQFTIHLPLTLAVTQVVLLLTGGRIYAVPSVLVEQVQQLKANALATAYNDGAVQWQGARVPLYYLSSLLGDTQATPVAQQYSPVVILKSGNDRVAVHIDEVIGNREAVVKNIGPQLARMIGIAGATVLGSGEIVLILNPVPLAQRADQENLRSPRMTPADGIPLLGAVAEMSDGFAPQIPSSKPVPGLRTQHTVMVVDDSLTVRRVTQRLLAREGFQVVLAKDGVDALQQLQSITPDIMLVDIEMPRMDGFDLTRNVRGDERTRHIPIIMITSRTASKHRNYAVELGVNEFFGKPYQEEQLLKAIAGFLDNRVPAV